MKSKKILINDKITQCEIVLEKLGNGELLYEIKEVHSILDAEFCNFYKTCEDCIIGNNCLSLDNNLKDYINSESETSEELKNEIRSIKRVYEGLL